MKKINKNILLLIISFVILLIIFLFEKLNLILDKSDNNIKISITNWIGYSPLLYAYETGMLKDLNIELKIVSSLNDNKNLYEDKYVDILIGTQYEYLDIKKQQNNNIIPLKLIDISNGGDVILSNKDLKEILKTNRKLKVYMEIDSVNSLLFEFFKNKNNIDKNKIEYINKNQNDISHMNFDMNETNIVVSYIPFHLKFIENGLYPIYSTKNNDSLYIFDGLFVDKDYYHLHKKELDKLKECIDLSIIEFQKNPEQYYETIKKYLKYKNYKDFKKQSELIYWINDDLYIQKPNIKSYVIR